MFILLGKDNKIFVKLYLNFNKIFQSYILFDISGVLRGSMGRVVGD